MRRRSAHSLGVFGLDVRNGLQFSRLPASFLTCSLVSRQPRLPSYLPPLLRPGPQTIITGFRRLLASSHLPVLSRIHVHRLPFEETLAGAAPDFFEYFEAREEVL